MTRHHQLWPLLTAAILGMGAAAGVLTWVTWVTWQWMERGR